MLFLQLRSFLLGALFLSILYVLGRSLVAYLDSFLIDLLLSL
jgi:hypothetical protein